MGIWLRRLAYLLRQARHDAELREEIEAHRALRAAHLEREGLAPPDAAVASRRAIGNVLLARDDVRRVWLGSADEWWQDVRYGLRTLRRNRTFAAAAIVTLALGIGANAGLFTVVNAILFRDVPAPRADELVSMAQSVHGVQAPDGDDRFSTSDYLAYRAGVRTLSGLAAYGNARGETTLGGDRPVTLLGTLVSCNYFDVLETPPALGRALAAHDCEPGADPVVILSHQLWQSVFGADPGIVGRTIQLNRQQVAVAGVAAARTYNGSPFIVGGYFAPLNAGRWLGADTRYGDAGVAWLSLLGRRRDGVGLTRVRAEMDVIATRIDRQQSGRSTTLTIERATPALGGQLRGAATGSAAVLMAAFGFVLLIACANVANLLLARGASRGHEIGVRLSLGASRARVVRQLLAESVMMAAVAGTLGSAAALSSFQTLIEMAVPALLPPWAPLTPAVDLSPDLRVVLFAAALTIGTAVLCGVAPALHLSRPDVVGVMKHGAAAGASGTRSSRLQRLLVAVQVALCMVLGIAAGLLLRGLHATYTVDPGFAYRDVGLVSLESAFFGYSDEEAAARRAQLVASLERTPGVEAVASADQEPLGDDMSPVLIRRRGDGERDGRAGELTAVSPNYFSVLEIPIVRGRSFTGEEVRNQGARPRPAIVSATTARNLWPGSDPIGQTLLSAPVGMAADAETLEVVGVAADAQVEALGRIDSYYVYVPGQGSALLIKSRADVATAAAGIRSAVRAVDPSLPLDVLPLEATLGWSRGISRTVTALFAGLGALALVLAAVGVYGVVAFAVTRRAREIGIRLALGARVQDVLGLILGQTMRPVAIGAACGVLAAAALSRVLSSVLFGVSPADPAGFGGAAVFVAAVALAAGLVAARPVARADPTATLRCE